MTVIQKTIGRLPVNLGDYDSTRAYGKKNRVLLYGCEWESKVNNNTYAPATLNTTTGVITPDTTHWKLINGSYNTWLIDNGYQKMAASNVKDSDLNDTQDNINASIIGEIGSDSSANTIKGRIKVLETSVGSGGSVDERIAAEGAQHYLKSETYTKSEVNGMITTPDQEYVTVTATDQTTAVTDVLPATGSADTVYRVGSWNGNQYDATVYSEYAWNESTSQYIHLRTKTQIGEVFDISAYHATGGTLATYSDLNDAINGVNGGVPQSLQKGGMSIKYVQTYDNKYVQYLLISDSFTTDIRYWYGVNDEIAKELKANYNYFNFNKLEFTDGSYIKIDNGTLKQPTENGNYRYAKVACQLGNVFTLNIRTSNGSGTYAFFDANGNWITGNTTGGTYEKMICIAPANAAWFVVNDSLKLYNSYYGRCTDGELAYFKSVEAQINKYNGAFENKDYSIKGTGYINSSGAVVSSTTYYHTEPIIIKAGHKCNILTKASSSAAAVSLYNEDVDLITPLLMGIDPTNIQSYTVDATNEDRKIIVSCIYDAVIQILDSENFVNTYKRLEAKESYINKDIVTIPIYDFGYWDTSGSWHQGTSAAPYKTYHLILNAGDSILLHFGASASVAAVSSFNDDFSVLQSVLKTGNDGTVFSDFRYIATEKINICVCSSSNSNLTVQYINRGKIARFEITDWVNGYYLKEEIIPGTTVTLHSEYKADIVSSPAYRYTYLIPLRRGDILYVKNLTINKNTIPAGLYIGDSYLMDLTKDIKQDTVYTTDFEYVGEYPLSYIRVCARIDANAQVFVIETGYNGRGILHPSHLDNKSLNIIGDSYIAAEHSNEQYNNVWYHWAGLIAQEHNMTYRNYGKGGMQSDWVIENIPNMNAVADYVGVVCGKNDYNVQKPLTSFRNNINTIIDLLLDKYITQGTKLFFGTPWRVSEETEVAVGGEAKNIPLQDYVDTIVDVCASRSFPCFDASRKSGVFCENLKFRQTFMMTPTDISHMNPKGFAYVKTKWESFMESL